ncbi:MaoC family dehydratase [Cupriavidus pauculus]|uniref:MaoC family dehydratase n=1 Tax=Cupriavidus pauculus TaxID=82633 RepID=UPI001FD026EE|nr:MaoC family dehydratase [Cupriavidus pauculus]
MRFSDFFTGQKIQAGPYHVTTAEISQFAHSFDPQWFHVDETAAARGHFGSLIASGWHTCAIAMRLVVDAALIDSESFASPGLDYVTWMHPVKGGDALYLIAEVIECRRSKKNETLGVLRWRWRMHDQHSMEVLDLVATSLFRLDVEGSA